jgi:putative ABC transport system permease protein
MKILDIFFTANANLFRNKVRTILTIIAIFVGAFTITLTTALNAGVNGYIDAQINAIGGDNIVMVTPKTDTDQQSGPKKYDPDSKAVSMSQMTTSASPANLLQDEDLDKIRDVEGVKEAEVPQVPSIEYIQVDNSDKYEFSVRQNVEGIQNDALEGSDNPQGNEILLGLEYIEPLGLGDKKNVSDAVGKTAKIAVENPITKETKVFYAKIAGVLNDSIMGSFGASSLISQDLCTSMVDFASQLPQGAPEVQKRGSRQAYVIVDDGQASDVRDRLKELGYTAMTVPDMIGTVKSIIDAITYVLIAFAAIALLAAAFGIINTLFMSVSERTREIGLMKAMGMSSFKVFSMFSAEAILIGIWGSAVAIAAAFGVGQTVNKIGSETFLKDLSGLTLMQYPIANIAIVSGIIILIAFLSGTIPSAKASRMNPIDSLRYE